MLSLGHAGLILWIFIVEFLYKYCRHVYQKLTKILIFSRFRYKFDHHDLDFDAYFNSRQEFCISIKPIKRLVLRKKAGITDGFRIPLITFFLKLRATVLLTDSCFMHQNTKNCEVLAKLKLSTIVTSPRIIRSMPNTPMMVGEGITVYCSNNAESKDLELIDMLFSYIGMSQNVPESLMNGIGGVSGSGPAFAYLVIEALADGAVRMGVPRPMATKFAAQVLVGAGKMVLETGRHPGQLKDEVCSPGGTTITGIHAMEVGGVRGSIMNAVEAAVNKTNELTSRLN
ncbi:pyrroline 5-carboyxlate reductase isoform X3 [Temnothorax americanus]|uniref:pyrroline 5-carboyxlate reductase isoform X3 n=1 Tax=Temnothorax americanus TaxID=1964332 RepID=UPI004068E5C0